MEEKITHEMLAKGIERLEVLTQDIIQLVGAKFDSVDIRLEEVTRNVNLIKDRTERVEHAIWRLQADMNIVTQEMRGIHKVLDNFGNRVFELEKALKMA